MTLDQEMRAVIERSIAKHGGNVTRAAEELGISIRTIRRPRRLPQRRPRQ